MFQTLYILFPPSINPCFTYVLFFVWLCRKTLLNELNQFLVHSLFPFLKVADKVAHLIAINSGELQKGITRPRVKVGNEFVTKGIAKTLLR